MKTLMKVEVIKRSTQKPIVTYSVPDFYMSDFQEWKDESEPVLIPLNKLKDTVDNLDAKDPETQEPVSNPQEVDFYLPDPIKNRVIAQLAKPQTDLDREAERLEITERISTPVLKSSTILSAVVEEILQNHRPPSDYKVRISDG